MAAKSATLVYKTGKEITSESNLRVLLSSKEHTLIVQSERADLILSRIKLLGLILALLMIAWIPVDITFMEWNKISGIVGARLAAAITLIALILYQPKISSLSRMYWKLFFLLAIPMIFFWYCNTESYVEIWVAEPVFIKSAYAHFPILVVMLLSLFPLTAAEGSILGSVLVTATALVAVKTGAPAHLLLDFGTLWLLVIVAGFAIIASMSQLHFMTGFVEYSTHDEMTGFIKRDYGALLLETLLHTSERNKTPLTVAFIDLDDFKKVNDVYGHDAGDGILKESARHMKEVLRRQDVTIRWGGEEFVIIMPGTNSRAVAQVLERLRESGLGRRPDGKIQTASVGIAEYVEDGVQNAQTLIEIADQRMYEAKKSGKNTVMLKTGSFPLLANAGDSPLIRHSRNNGET